MSVSLPKVPGVTVSLPTISTVSSNANVQNVNNIQPGQSLLTANRVQPGKYQNQKYYVFRNAGHTRPEIVLLLAQLDEHKTLSSRSVTVDIRTNEEEDENSFQ